MIASGLALVEDGGEASRPVIQIPMATNAKAPSAKRLVRQREV
jgi:hypothetical protein